MNELNDLLNEWKNGRMTDFVSAIFPPGMLREVPHYFVIVSEMPIVLNDPTPMSNPDAGTFDQDIFIDRKKTHYVLHVFSHIGSARMGNKMLMGPIWDDNLKAAMPFPTREMAEEFNAKVINLSGTRIMTVRELLPLIDEQELITKKIKP